MLPSGFSIPGFLSGFLHATGPGIGASFCCAPMRTTVP